MRRAALLAIGLGACVDPASEPEDGLSIDPAELPGCSGRYDDPLDEYAYLVSASDGGLLQVNPRSCTVGATIGTGSHPVSAAVTGSGRWIYVGDDVDRTLTVVSQARNEVSLSLDLGFVPDDLMFEPAHTVLWAADRQTGEGALVESEHHTVIARVALEPGFTHLAATDAAPQTMLAAHPDGFAQVFDLVSRTEVARVQLGGEPLAIHYASNTGDAWTCLGGEAPELAVFAASGPSAFVVTGRIPLDAPCAGLRFDGFRYGVAFQPDRDQALLIDTELREIAARVPVGRTPEVLVLNGDMAAIGAPASGELSLISLRTLTETARVPLGGASGQRLQDGLDPNFVYVRDPDRGTVVVVDLRDGSSRPPIDLGAAGEDGAMVIAGPKGGKCH